MNLSFKVTKEFTVWSLTERQLEILHLLVQGRTNSEIADQLFLSLNTIKWHLQQIYKELDVRNRVEAIAAAQQHGLLTDESESLEEFSTLPIPATPFFGRAQELGQLGELLARPGVRLISICGLGGTGKTRLAQAAAAQYGAQFADGVFFVSINELPDNGMFWEVVRLTFNIPARKQHTPQRLVQEFFAKKEALLIIDGYEAHREISDSIQILLSRTRSLKCLVTSRQRLDLKAESCFPINGLSHVRGQRSPAYDLFINTARRENPNFEPNQLEIQTIVDLCQTVDGMPLAIELAATWADVLPVDELLSRLQSDIAFFRANATDRPKRQQSLQSVFAYAWRRLSDEERRVVLKLSPISGPFSKRAALDITGASPAILKKLTRLSMIQSAEHNMLVIHELLRLFFQSQIVESEYEPDQLQEQVMTYFLTMLGANTRELRQTMKATLLHSIDRDWRQIKVAWEQAIAQRRWDLLELCGDIFMYFEAHGRWPDGVPLLSNTLLEVPQNAVRLRAQLQEGLSLLVMRNYDIPSSKRYADQALALYDSLPNVQGSDGIYAHIAQFVYVYAAKGFGAYTKLIQDILPLIQEHFGEFGRIMPLMFDAQYACASGQHLNSANMFQEILMTTEPGGYHLPNIRGMLAVTLRAAGDLDAAKEQFLISQREGHTIGVQPAIVASAYELALIDQPNLQRADLLAHLMQLTDVLGGRPQLGRQLIILGGTYVGLGQAPRARQLFWLGLSVLRGHISADEMADMLIVVGKFMLYQLTIAGRR